jgi:hypothetical protein
MSVASCYELPGGDDAAGSVIPASRDWVLGVFVEPVHTVVGIGDRRGRNCPFVAIWDDGLKLRYNSAQLHDRNHPCMKWVADS